MNHPKTLLFLSLIVIVVLIMSSSLLAQPRLTIKNNSFDFGFVPQNSKISHNFWLYSTGEDTLRILRVKPG